MYNVQVITRKFSLNSLKQIYNTLVNKKVKVKLKLKIKKVKKEKQDNIIIIINNIIKLL